MTDNSNRVAVVGGGAAGLTAAVTIAAGGVPVTLFERAKAAGGRAQTWQEADYRFNLGPHALYPSAQQVLRESGIDVRGSKPNVAGLALYRGRLQRLPVSPWSIMQTGLLAPLEKAEFAKLFATIGRHGPEAWADRPLTAWLESVTSRETVRALTLAIMRLATYTDAPESLSAGAALRQLRGATGILYIDNGWGAIVEALRDRLTGAGGEVRSGARVESVRSSSDGIAIRTRGGEERFAAAVVTGSPADVTGLLGDGAGAALHRAQDTAVPVQAAVLDVGLRRLPRPRRTFAIGIDRPLYYSVHSATARGLAPEGAASVSTAFYIRPGERIDAAEVERELEAFLDALQPGWQDQVEVRRFLPSLVVATAFPAASHGGLPGRPGVDATGVPGVFMAGDWVGPDGLLADAAFGSGQAAGERALQTAREAAGRPAGAVA